MPSGEHGAEMRRHGLAVTLPSSGTDDRFTGIDRPNGDTICQSHALCPTGIPPGRRSWPSLYFSGTINTFVLYGNVHDLVRMQIRRQQRRSCSLQRLPGHAAFRRLGRRAQLRPRPWPAARRRRRRQTPARHGAVLVRPIGRTNTWPRDPDKVARRCSSRFFERNLLEDNVAQPQAHRAPLRATRSSCSPPATWRRRPAGQAARLVRFLGWAAEPVHQAAQHRLLPDRRQALRDQRAAGAKPARRDDRDSACPARTTAREFIANAWA